MAGFGPRAVDLGVVEKWSINPEYPKGHQRKVKRYFYEIFEDDRLQDPESLFKVNVFYSVLDIIINQLRSHFHEIVSDFSVLQNLNDADLLEKAFEFVDLYKKDIPYLSRLSRKFSVFAPLLETK